MTQHIDPDQRDRDRHAKDKSIDELVAKGHSLIDRVRPVVQRVRYAMTPNQQPSYPIVKHSPVRDDEALGPTEDLDRQPDGMPHHVIGLTALFSVMLAMLIAFMVLAGGTVSRVAAILLAALAVPVLVSSLRRKADTDRDHLHPSR